MKHELKILEHYQERREIDGIKNWELRKNDRDFQVGDTIVFDVGNIVTGGLFVPQYKSSEYIITYVLQDFPGLEKGYCILSLSKKVGDK